MATDSFAGIADTPISPARRAYAVMPSDHDPLPRLPKALFVGGAGELVVRAVDSSQDVVLTVSAGQILPLRTSHVRATGTTAAGIVALA